MFHQHDTPVDIDDGHAADSLTPLSDLLILGRNDVAILIGTRVFGIDDIFKASESGERLFEGVVIAATTLELLCEIDAGVLVGGGGFGRESVEMADGALCNHCGGTACQSDIMQ